MATNVIEDVPDMTFSSSPLRYPMSSSPIPTAPLVKQKRKLFQSLAKLPSPKKPKLHIPTTVEIADIDDMLRDEVEVALPTIPELQSVQIAQNESELSLPTQTAPAINLGRGMSRKTVDICTDSGKTIKLAQRKKKAAQTYEQLISDRSTTAPNAAKRAYYGIEIHQLIDDAKLERQLLEAAKEHAEQQRAVQENIRPSVEQAEPCRKSTQMWTEKYRAKKFTELVGDERTHRSVLKWLKGWDNVVFPGNKKKIYEDNVEFRKIMLLTGPPGLGKTTLAHVCARQAGYEVLEINASDDRSRDVVKGRIKDCLGTETVKGIADTNGKRRAGRPVCVIVDEVDGVVTGSSSGEGGFMKALIDLVQLDQRNQTSSDGRRRKGDKFKLLRPLILICNDVYAPSLRPLRQSSIAEIVHVRKPPLDKVVGRLKMVFDQENIPCDGDAVRRLCEEAWGLGSKKNSSTGSRGSGDGDIRGILVQGEWMAHKLKQEEKSTKMTRKWIENQITASTRSRAGPRGGNKEILDRIFLEGAGLPILPSDLSAEEKRLAKESKSNPIGVADLRKRAAITALREMIDTVGEQDRLVSDCWSTYGSRVFQDDTVLSKPNTSYDWLHFHDSVSSRIYAGQEWELGPYLSTAACGYHHLFASVDKGNSAWATKIEEDTEGQHPYFGPKADYAAHEAEKATKMKLSELQSSFSGEILRLFSSVDTIATELIPNVSKMLSPDVKPVVVAAVASVRKETERNCIQNSVRVMNALSIAFDKVKIETDGYGSGGFAMRMEPPIDSMATYHLSTKPPKSAQPTRYAIRQVLDQELRKEKILQASMSRQARGKGAVVATPMAEDDKENVNPVKEKKVMRDFFGRVIATQSFAKPDVRNDASVIAKSTATKGKAKTGNDGDEGRIWVSFHEGYSNAVRKPITLADFMDGF